MFRSVCNLWLQKRMCSSDATCCAILAVNTWFFSLRVGQPSYRASRSPKTWYLTHNLVPMRLPKTAHLIMMASKFFSSSKMSKTGKNQKIRYKSVITKNPLYLKNQKSILIQQGVLRSVRHLEVHKRMCSSDDTCCASMPVNTWFFSPFATTSIICPPGPPKLGT